MTKKANISIILSFVFSFVLVHNIIPHHHHDEISEIYNHEHKHHHDKKGQDHHGNDEPIGLFSHPTHILAPTEFIVSSDESIQKNQYVKQFFLISDLVIEPIAIPILRKPPKYISAIPLQLFRSPCSRRGPPVFSV